MRRLVLATVVAGVAFLPATAVASPGTIQSRLNGKCLDAGSALVGTRVSLWSCNGSLQQQWNFESNGAMAVIRSAATGRCLDADTNTIGRNGTIVQLWDCNGASQQQWIVRDGGIFNRLAGQALDADTNTSANEGGIVHLWRPNGAAQQRWSVPPGAAPCARKPLGGGNRISARLAVGGSRGRARATLTTALGRRVRVTGTVVNSDGTQVAGARVNVCAQGKMPADRPAILGTVTTNARGGYRFVLPGGPSRKVWVVHEVEGGVITARATLRVRPRVTLHAVRSQLVNGEELVLSGRLSRPLPSRGALVLIQVWRDDRWLTFTSARSSRKGRFRASYTFTRTVGDVRYRMRALVPVQSSYPYFRGASRAVTVRVRS